MVKWPEAALTDGILGCPSFVNPPDRTFRRPFLGPRSIGSSEMNPTAPGRRPGPQDLGSPATTIEYFATSRATGGRSPGAGLM